jgi:hypothetical protein
MFIRPKHSQLKVPDPVRKDFLPNEGREVESSPYWNRRVNAQEVEIIMPKVEVQKTSKNIAKGE